MQKKKKEYFHKPKFTEKVTIQILKNGMIHTAYLIYFRS